MCKHKDQELSANTVAFISCRGILTIVLAGAIRGEKVCGGGGGRVRLIDVDTGRLLGLKYELAVDNSLLVSTSGNLIRLPHPHFLYLP